VSAAPIKGLFVTWTLITSRERRLSLAGHKLHDLLFEFARSRIDDGTRRGAETLD